MNNGSIDEVSAANGAPVSNAPSTNLAPAVTTIAVCNPVNCAVARRLAALLEDIVAGRNLASGQSVNELGLQDETGGAGTGANDSAQITQASAAVTYPTTKKSSEWTPRAGTLQVIKLMQQGLSIDDIAARKGLDVENNSANLRKIRQRAREHGLLPTPGADKRDTP